MKKFIVLVKEHHASTTDIFNIGIDKLLAVDRLGELVPVEYNLYNNLYNMLPINCLFDSEEDAQKMTELVYYEHKSRLSEYYIATFDLDDFSYTTSGMLFPNPTDIKRITPDMHKGDYLIVMGSSNKPIPDWILTKSGIVNRKSLTLGNIISERMDSHSIDYLKEYIIDCSLSIVDEFISKGRSLLEILIDLLKIMPIRKFGPIKFFALKIGTTTSLYYTISDIIDISNYEVVFYAIRGRAVRVADPLEPMVEGMTPNTTFGLCNNGILPQNTNITTTEIKRPSKDSSIFKTESAVKSVDRDVYKGTNHISTDIACMCNKCYNLFRMNISGMINFSSPDIDRFDIPKYSIPNKIYGVCNYCNEVTTFQRLDVNIATVVSVLNKKGYKTMQSHEGYQTDTKISTASIAFDRHLIEYDFGTPRIFDKILLLKITLIDDWFVDVDAYTQGHTLIIRAKDIDFNRWDVLLKWAQSLPELNEN